MTAGASGPAANGARRRLALARRMTWAVWGVATLSLALPIPGSVWQLLVGALSILGAVALLGLYAAQLAQWRMVGLAWAVYLALRLLALGLDGAALPLLAGLLVALAQVLALEAMLAALAAISVLAVRRDVSVAYVALAYGLGAWLMWQWVRAAGGVLNFLTVSLSDTTNPALLLIGPAMVSMACMATLGWLSFLPHLVYKVVRELRGD